MNDNDELDDDIMLPQPVPCAAPEPTISNTAKQLIKLRDKVLMSMADGAAPSPDLLDAIYREIGRVLEGEGITPVEDDGVFDYNRHSIVETRPTGDPEQNNRICGTVRPGYAFEGKLVRAQEVVVFALEKR